MLLKDADIAANGVPVYFALHCSQRPGCPETYDHYFLHGQVSIDSEQPVVWMEEENYMFRLSNFREDLHRWLDTDGRYMFRLFNFREDLHR